MVNPLIKKPSLFDLNETFFPYMYKCEFYQLKYDVVSDNIFLSRNHYKRGEGFNSNHTVEDVPDNT